MSKSKFTELIAVRFSEQDLKRLQEAADEQGIGASTLVRILVNRALKPVNARPRRLTADEFRDVMASTLARLDRAKVDSFFKEIAVGSPDEPTLLMWAGQTKKWEEFTSHFLKALLASLGVEVSLSEDNQLIEVSKEPASPARDEQNVQAGTLK